MYTKGMQRGVCMTAQHGPCIPVCCKTARKRLSAGQVGRVWRKALKQQPASLGAWSDSKSGALQENLQAWMADRRGRDQFAARWGDETEVFWNDAARGVAEQARAHSPLPDRLGGFEVGLVF